MDFWYVFGRNKNVDIMSGTRSKQTTIIVIVKSFESKISNKSRPNFHTDVQSTIVI